MKDFLKDNLIVLLCAIITFVGISAIVKSCNREECPYTLLEVEYIDLHTGDTLHVILNTKKVEDDYKVIDQEWIEPTNTIKVLEVKNYGPNV